MSAYGNTLRAIVANLFGLKQTLPPPAGAVDAQVRPHPSDEQLTVPGYYVSSPHKASRTADAQAAVVAGPGIHPQRDALGASLKAARGSVRPSQTPSRGPRSRVSSPG